MRLSFADLSTKVTEFLSSITTKSDSANGTGRTGLLERFGMSFNAPQLRNNAATNDEIFRLLSQKVQLNRQDEPQRELKPYELIVFVPEGQETASYNQLERTVIKNIFDQNGVQCSKAALDTIVEQEKLDMSPKYDLKQKKYEYNDKDGLLLKDAKPDVMVINGKAHKVVKLTISPDLQAGVLANKGKVAEITASGIKAFSELSMEERMTMAIERSGKYLPQSASEALSKVEPRQVMTGIVLAGGVVALAKKGIRLPPVIGTALTMAAVTDYWADAQLFMRDCAKAKSPEDLDKAAQRFAQVVQNVGVDAVMNLATLGAEKALPKLPKVNDALKKIDGYLDDAIAFGERQIKNASDLADDLLPSFGVTPDGQLFPMPKKSGVNDIDMSRMEMRGEHRINIRKGDGSRSSGMEYAWRRHGGGGSLINKSQFTISREKVEALIQRKDVIKTPPVLDPDSGNYIREVDVGEIVGNVPLKKGGHATSVITVITDEAGNLVNVFPGRLDFGATLP